MKKFRKNNKGFTLVELIIVVAIIAVLSAVAAPQYIQYVERSRQGVDASTLEEVRHAVEVEVGVMESIESGTKITIDRTGAITGAGTFDNDGEAADQANFKQITDVVGESVELKSKAATKDGAANVVINVSTEGVVTWDGASVPVTGDDGKVTMSAIKDSALFISNLKAGKAS